MHRLLLGISDDKTREELLSTHDLTLSKTIEIVLQKRLPLFTRKLSRVKWLIR